MDVPPNLTLMADVMKEEKKLFWMRNQDLPEKQRQLLWTAHTAELTSLLGHITSIEPSNPQVDVAEPKLEQQSAAMTQWNHPALIPDPSVIAHRPQYLAY